MSGYAYTDTPRVRHELAYAVLEGLDSSFVGLLHTLLVSSKWLNPDGTVSRPVSDKEMKAGGVEAVSKRRKLVVEIGRLDPRQLNTLARFIDTLNRAFAKDQTAARQAPILPPNVIAFPGCGRRPSA